MRLRHNLMNTQTEKQQVTQYIETEQEHFLAELIRLLKIESISTDPKFKSRTLQCAQATADYCKQIGLENAKLIETKGYPLVYADWLHAGVDKPTVLVYGHYD